MQWRYSPAAFWRWLVIGVLTVMFCPFPTVAQPNDLVNPEKAAPEAVRIYRVPLDKDGNVNMRPVLEHLFDEAGLDGSSIADKLNLDLPVKGPIGATTMSLVNNFTSPYVMVHIKDDQLEIVVSTIRLRGSVQSFRNSISELLSNFYPDIKTRLPARIGLYVADRTGAIRPVSDSEQLQPNAVILIHGLHPIPSQWNELCAALVGANYQVIETCYDDLQPIADSADSVAGQLKDLKLKHGVKTIAIITHSMGGLIARDVLTRTAYYGGVPTGHDTLPDLKVLIMVAPPNHGSTLALIKLSSNFLEDIERTLSGKGMLIGSFFDGAGKAQDDLNPDSAFLSNLNKQPLPENLQITIIAGSASPYIHDQLVKEQTTLSEMTKFQRSNDDVDGIDRKLASLADGLGDGAVSLDSAKLQGVKDFVVIPANHVTLIHNPFGIISHETPPAIPIIMDRLKAQMPVSSNVTSDPSDSDSASVHAGNNKAMDDSHK